jgi:hypothetical protein
MAHLRTARQMRQPRAAARRAAGTDRRCGFHPRAAGRGRGPRRARPLGRRPSLRSQQHTHRDARRASYALCDASQDPLLLLKIPSKDTATLVGRFLDFTLFSAQNFAN